MFFAVGDRDLRACPSGCGLREGPDRLGAVGGGDRHPDPRAGAVGVALVVERDRDLDEAVGAAAARRRIRAGSAPARAGCSSRRSSLRSLPRTQPFCTKVSLPSGLTSLIVAWRSTLGVEERTQSVHGAGADHRRVFGQRIGEVGDGAARRALLPLVVRAWRSRGRRSPTAVSPLKSVGGRAWAFQVKPSACGPAGGWSLRPPSGERYQEWASVPGIGNSPKDSSKPG